LSNLTDSVVTLGAAEAGSQSARLSLATSRRKIDVFQPLVNGMRQDKSRRAVRRGVKRAVMAPTPTG
jgi:hypothetical protein